MVAGERDFVFEEMEYHRILSWMSIGARPDFLPGNIISYMVPILKQTPKSLLKETKQGFKK